MGAANGCTEFADRARGENPEGRDARRCSMRLVCTVQAVCATRRSPGRRHPPAESKRAGRRPTRRRRREGGRALGDAALLGRGGGEHHRPHRVRGPGLGALDAGQPVPARAGAVRTHRHGEPAVVPRRLRRDRRLRRFVLVHRLGPARRLRPRYRAERHGFRVRAGAGNDLPGHRRDHEQAPGAGELGQQPEHQLLRDGAVAGRGGLVHQRPRQRRHLRRHRHVAGDFLGLRRRPARLRIGRSAQLHAGRGNRGTGRTGAGQRELRLASGAGLVVPVGGPGDGRVCDEPVGHGDRYRAR